MDARELEELGQELGLDVVGAATVEPYPQQGAAPQAPPLDDKLEQLKQLGELKASGVLTDAEFEAQKAKILAG